MKTSRALTEVTDDKLRVFPDGLSEGLPITYAAKQAGVHRQRMYALKARDDEFSAEWDAAYKAGGDALEAEARRRAVEGVLEPVYQKGQLVGQVRKFSDTLLIFLMKAREPEKYRDNYHIEHTGPGGGPLLVMGVVEHRLTAPTGEE